MRYYIESDGQVFLVMRDGRLDLPEANEVPFPVEPIAPLAGDVAWYCVPTLDRHPEAWSHKDRIQASPDVAPAVRTAVHATMPRVVVEGLCLRGSRILLVKGGRGLTRGIWTLPGGFLRFGETTEACVLREIREEVGMTGSVDGLVAVRSRIGQRTRLHWTTLFYRVTVAGEPAPNPDEIAEARFMETEDGLGLLEPEMRAIVRGLL
jgi:ADP-ribose pyrophosphatase YjhB (NUDIX family)